MAKKYGVDEYTIKYIVGHKISDIWITYISLLLSTPNYCMYSIHIIRAKDMRRKRPGLW